MSDSERSTVEGGPGPQKGTGLMVNACGVVACVWRWMVDEGQTTKQTKVPCMRLGTRTRLGSVVERVKDDEEHYGVMSSERLLRAAADSWSGQKRVR